MAFLQLLFIRPIFFSGDHSRLRCDLKVSRGKTHEELPVCETFYRPNIFLSVNQQRQSTAEVILFSYWCFNTVVAFITGSVVVLHCGKAHTTWGKETLLHLYRSLIRSKLDYGCVVYGSKVVSTDARPYSEPCTALMSGCFQNISC